jgi:hypothetical protein
MNYGWTVSGVSVIGALFGFLTSAVGAGAIEGAAYTAIAGAYQGEIDAILRSLE